MPQSYVFVPIEEAERAGLARNQAISVYALDGYKLQGVRGFPFTPTANGDAFRTSGDADICSEMSGNPAFIRIVVYSGN
ncbi:MAG: hypothetical protein HY365_03800 [Candidatus Aenigmarchaeota archaeon]|nr:hypothetical protein [Candidatus Aenigmarchaeota archaeon]